VQSLALALVRCTVASLQLRRFCYTTDKCIRSHFIDENPRLAERPLYNVHGIPIPMPALLAEDIQQEKYRYTVRAACLKVFTVLVNHSGEGLSVVVECLDNAEESHGISKRFGVLVESLCTQLRSGCEVFTTESWTISVRNQCLCRLCTASVRVI
jgi:hypothetical protein